jgi:hypothetical protein
MRRPLTDGLRPAAGQAHRLGAADCDSAAEVRENPAIRSAPLSSRPCPADTWIKVSPRVALLALLSLVCGCQADEPTPCDGFADRRLAVSGAEYRGCAGEILAALDVLEPPLQAIVSNRATGDQRDAARQAYRKLRRLIDETGIEADYRSLRPGTVIIKWPDGPVSAFNHSAFKATTQYMAVLAYPNADNFDQGVRAHDEARRHYRAMR